MWKLAWVNSFGKVNANGLFRSLPQSLYIFLAKELKLGQNILKFIHPTPAITHEQQHGKILAKSAQIAHQCRCPPLDTPFNPCLLTLIKTNHILCHSSSIHHSKHHLYLKAGKKLSQLKVKCTMSITKTVPQVGFTRLYHSTITRIRMLQACQVED